MYWHVMRTKRDTDCLSGDCDGYNLALHLDRIAGRKARPEIQTSRSYDTIGGREWYITGGVDTATCAGVGLAAQHYTGHRRARLYHPD